MNVFVTSIVCLSSPIQAPSFRFPLHCGVVSHVDVCGLWLGCRPALDRYLQWCLAMSELLNTFKTYNPITLVVGISFVGVGIWGALFCLRGVPTSEGLVFILVFAVLLPLSLGAAIIENQLRLRKKSN